MRAPTLKLSLERKRAQTGLLVTPYATAAWKLAALGLSICVLTSCDPPGKPNTERAAENRENIVDFQTLFENNCAGCHGEAGRNGPARILNDPLYLAIIPRDTLRDVVANGRPGTAMPAWARSHGGPLTDKQIDALVYGIYSTWAKPANLGSPIPAYTAMNNGDANHGKQLFVRDCFACHGKGAPIGSITEAAYLSLVTNQMLRTSIIVGRPDLGMPDYRHLNLGKALSDQDVTDLVSYVSSMRPANIENERQGAAGGQITSATGPHVNENETGRQGQTTRGNEGSGNGPGSPRNEQNEGIKGPQGSSSQQGVK